MFECLPRFFELCLKIVKEPTNHSNSYTVSDMWSIVLNRNFLESFYMHAFTDSNSSNKGLWWFHITKRCSNKQNIKSPFFNCISYKFYEIDQNLSLHKGMIYPLLKISKFDSRFWAILRLIMGNYVFDLMQSSFF